MTQAARIYQFQRPESQETVLADTGETCALLQRELALLAQQPGRGVFGKLAKRSGVGEATIRRLLYGDTHAPRFNTCIRLLNALGFTLVARR